MNRHPLAAGRLSRLAAAAALMIAAPLAFAQSYNYISPSDFKQRLESGNKPLVVDIQVESDFAKHHVPGAVPTYAYPAKTDAERDKLKPMISKIMSTQDDVVIVCPGGATGAKNTIDYLKSQGVPEKRLLILEKGQRGWPYPELTVKN